MLRSLFLLSKLSMVEETNSILLVNYCFTALRHYTLRSAPLSKNLMRQIILPINICYRRDKSFLNIMPINLYYKEIALEQQKRSYRMASWRYRLIFPMRQSYSKNRKIMDTILKPLSTKFTITFLKDVIT